MPIVLYNLFYTFYSRMETMIISYDKQIYMRRDSITIFLVPMVSIYLFMYKFKNVNR
jgi:hypothetical protein